MSPTVYKVPIVVLKFTEVGRHTKYRAYSLSEDSNWHTNSDDAILHVSCILTHRNSWYLIREQDVENEDLLQSTIEYEVDYQGAYVGTNRRVEFECFITVDIAHQGE
jgi:hypothetical protein